MEDYIKRTYEKSLKEGDLTACLSIAKNATTFKIDLAELERAVIKSNNPLYAYNFVKDFKCGNKKAMEKIVIDSKNGNIASGYAVKNKKDCDIKALEEIVLKFGDAFDSAYFVTNIDEADVERHKGKILEEEEAYACYLFCRKFQPYGRELKPFQDIVIESEDAEFATAFAKDVYDADILSLGNVVLENGGINDMIEFSLILKDKIKDEMKSIKGNGDISNLIACVTSSSVIALEKLRYKIEDYVFEYATDDELVDYFLIIDDVEPFEVQKRVEASGRQDLKLKIAMDSRIDLSSLTKSINRRDRVEYKIIPKDNDREL